MTNLRQRKKKEKYYNTIQNTNTKFLKKVMIKLHEGWFNVSSFENTTK